MYRKAESSVLVRDLRAESRSLGAAWIDLQDQVHQLELYRENLERDWADLEEERERLNKERQRFEKLVAQEWFPERHEQTNEQENTERPARIVRVNVGGQVFEVSSKLLEKDRFSLLAAISVPEEDSVLKPSKDGCFFFDRDWFLFKHILTYLQSGTLPKDISRLKQLHHECGFYCLFAMRRKIETVLADMRRESKPHDDPHHQDGLYQSAYHRALSASHARRKRQTTLATEELPDPFGFTNKTKTSYKL